MSSNFKLMLRPPPHVEFLQGYPGIAPHGERKSALVQGTLEVRGNVKAKWVRVELRKIEILPGGGQNSTFSETIGERPVTLWSSQQEEFAELGSKDFPFHISVPDAVPPSIALERGAAIKYELVASVMLKGKKSLFKRDPAPITTHTAPIVIEKYDLLQTWPIYSQPQSRQNSANGVTLIANFQQSAFGPGDVVPVEAILRAGNSGANIILRAYELTVRETLIFRSSPPPVQQQHSQQPPRRTPAAQTRSNVISDQNVPVPVQLPPGSQHRCDLGCQIPLAQTNVSVRTARHIEVNYMVVVKAVLASNATVSVEIPVTITNWQRQASQDAIRRIGFAPELVGVAGNASPTPGINPTSQVSLFHATNPPGVNGNGLGNGHGNGGAFPGPHSNGAPSSNGGSASIPERVSRRSTATADAHSPGRHTLGLAPGVITGRTDDIDELGYIPAHVQQNVAQTLPNRQSHQGTTNNSASQGGSSGVGGGGGRGSDRAPSEPEREEYFGNVQPLNSGAPPAAVPRPRSSSSRKSGVPAQQRFTVVNVDEPSGAGGSKPLSAEEEKRMLKEKYAKEEDRRKRRESDTARPAASTATAAAAGAAGGRGWLSAEEEKKRLFNSARQAAAKTQQSAGYEAPIEASPEPPADSGAGGSSSAAGGSKPAKKETSWPSAEEEKRAMFENARKAAQKTQQTVFEGHMPYDQGAGVAGDGGDVVHDKIGSGVPAFPQIGAGGDGNEDGAFVGGWAMGPGGPYSNTPFAAPQPTPYNEPWSFPSESQPPQPPQPEARPAPQQWLSAADEKRMLFEKARAAAEHTQRRATTSSPPIDDGNTPGASNAQSPGTSAYGTPSAASPYNSGSSYLNSGPYSNQLTASPTTTQPPSFLGGHTPAGNKTGSELFAAGLAAMGRESMYGSPKPSPTPPPMPGQGTGGRTGTPPYGGGSQFGHGGSQLGHSVSLHGHGGSMHGHGGAQLGHSVSMSHRFPSATDEKQALAYKAAMQRVEQARAGEDAGGSSANESAYVPYGGPPPGDAEPSSPGVPSYDALYGSQARPLTRPLSVQRRTPSSSGAASPPPRMTTSPPPIPSSDLPPNFTPNFGPTASALSALEEKARLRKQYEEQDAAGGQSGLHVSAPSVTPPPAQIPSYGSSAQEEKERMKQMYAEQDAALRTGERRATRDNAGRGALPAPPGASRVSSPPLPPPANVPDYQSNGSDPPPFMGGFVNPATMQPLSAVEEKARLRAQYEAQANGHPYTNGQASHDEAGPPPPSFESHYGPPESEPSPAHAQVQLPPPTGGLHRDPTISLGKRRATQTEEPPAMPPSGFVAPPPPPPLMPKPPATYIQETLALAVDVEGKLSGEWDHSRSVTPDLYDDEPRGHIAPNQQIVAPPLPPKLPA
ncbi:hypothetical protein BDV93DRAFT_477289 [Ceratobasidium sp. AG-I]|nr:hypothetical protein BDV93DRAFT_477289 [Ceratobasidium sp. AG-I]